MKQELLVSVTDQQRTTKTITDILKQMNIVRINLQRATAGQKDFILIIPIMGTTRYELSVQTNNQRLITEVSLFRQMKNMYITNISELVKKLLVWVRI